MSTWIKVGQIGVDSGTVMLCDPCYVLHRGERVFQDMVLDPPHPEFGKSWAEFSDALSKACWHNGVERVGTFQVGGRLAVVSPTHMGDGIYPVMARFDAEGRIEALKVVFNPSEEGES